MKRIIGFLAGIAILMFLSSGILSKLGIFFEWYFLLKHTQPDTSVAGSIAVRVLTHFVSFGLVGVVFETHGWFNGKIMGASYAFLSTILGFVFAYMVWTMEEHIVTIIIILSIVSALAVAFLILSSVFYKKEERETAQGQD